MAVLRHKPAQERDYLPHKRPFPYDIAAVKAALAEIDARVGVGDANSCNMIDWLYRYPPFTLAFYSNVTSAFADIELASGN